MKKLSIIFSVVVIIAPIAVGVYTRHHNSNLFTQNIEALMEGEHAFGYCDESSSIVCVGVCSDCGELVFASGHHGKGYNIHHIK